MKNKVFTLVVVVLLVMLVTPTPAFAYSGVDVEVRDNLTNDFWTHGGTIYVYNNTAGALIAAPYTMPEDAAAGPANIPYTATPSMNDSITIYVVTNPGPSGSPGVLQQTYSELDFVPGHYPATTIRTGTGPNAIELVDFSIAPQSNNITWLPFILLVGSVALVSGAVLVIRKRQA